MRLIARLIGYLIFLVAGLPIILLIMFIAGLQANIIGVETKVWPLSNIQRALYKNTRNIWQYQAECVQPDSDLIYKPTEGTCKLSNIEFESVLHFDVDGRSVPARDARQSASEEAIVILGDSHAMGWGVSDAQTFANILQEKVEQTVYNLAVSSYGTEREIQRFLQSGLADRTKVLVIQYCDNDLEENLRFPLDKAKPYEHFWARFSPEQYIHPAERTFANHLSQNLNLDVMFATIKAVMHPLIPDAIIRWRKSGLGFHNQFDSFKEHGDALFFILENYRNKLEGIEIFIIYSNRYGEKFSGFSDYRYGGSLAVRLLDINLSPDVDYYALDDHLNENGHRKIGEAITQYLKNGRVN